jgi:predicted O-methyltransferase YrrM
LVTAECFEDAWPEIDSIEGWLSKDQARALFEAARITPPGDWIVEIGSHHGRSTAALALGKPPSSQVLAVDPYFEAPYGPGEAAFVRFRENMRRLRLSRDVTLFRGTSEDAASAGPLLLRAAGPDDSGPSAPASTEQRIGLLFVDGRHDRTSVLTDIHGWQPYIVPGGRIFFHDAFFRTGVTLAVLQHYLLNTHYHLDGNVSNLVMFSRRPSSHMTNLKMARLLGFYFRNRMIKLAERTKWMCLQTLLGREEDFEY